MNMKQCTAQNHTIVNASTVKTWLSQMHQPQGDPWNKPGWKNACGNSTLFEQSGEVVAASQGKPEDPGAVEA